MRTIRDIGIVGLGNMGGRIARRIVAAGRPLAGFDVDAARVSEAGAEPAGSPAELAGRVDVAFLSLPDSPVVERVVYGDDGLLAGCRAGQVVVDLSTADPASSRRIHGDFAAADVEFVDAGISGGAAAAEKGTLTIMAGGSAEAVAALEDVFADFSSRVFHMGGPGSGHVTKLLNNFLNGMSLAATAEVMVAGKKAGLDLDRLLEVLNNSSGVNFATLNRFPRIVHGDYLEGGLTCNLQAKDIQLYLGVLRSLEVTSLTGPPALAAFHLANALGYGEMISNRVVDAIGDLAGDVRIQPDEEEAD